jgi:multidrug efflux pump
VTIVLSAFVSLTLTPMMSARLLRYTPPERQGRFYHVTENAFEKVIAFYGRTLRFVLRYQTLTLLIALCTLVLTGILYTTIPKGFFPTQDTGIIQGISQASAATSFESMTQMQQELAKTILADPAVESISSFIGSDGTNTTLNSGRIQINLKPLGDRGINALGVIGRLGPKLAQVAGIKLYMQPVQDLTVDDQVSRTEYQYTLEDPNQDELNSVVHSLTAKLGKLPELADVVTDQQLGGMATSLTIDRATASRFGITPAAIDNTLYDAFGQRQINTLYTELNQYHVILETDPRFQLSPAMLHDIYIQSAPSGSTSTVSSNTGGSSSGAGAGAAPSTGNALLTASSSPAVSSGNTSAISGASASNTSTPATSTVTSTSALSSA